MSSTNRSFLEIVDIFRQVSVNHSMINHFYVGAPYELTQHQDYIYPSVFFELNYNSSTTSGQRIYNFAFYVLDRAPDNAAGEHSSVQFAEKMLTKAEKITDNIIAKLYQDVKDLRIDSYNMLSALEEFNDRAWGQRVELSIRIPFNWSYCLIPYVEDIVNNYECITPTPTPPCTNTLTPSILILNNWITLPNPPRQFNTIDDTGTGTFTLLLGVVDCPSITITKSDITQPAYFDVVIIDTGQYEDGTLIYECIFNFDYDYINANTGIDFTLDLTFTGCCVSEEFTFQAIYDPF